MGASNFPSGVNGSTFIADPGAGGAVPVVVSGDVAFVTAGAEARTIANPTFSGQQIRGYFLTDGGNLTITVASAFDAAGNTTLLFEDAGDSFILEAFRTAATTYVWRLVHNDGGTPS